ncbi:coiled-coil domain-containing protein 167 isoform X1 [Pelodiscus sinensis]|uniref:coiled-coil domain-containing protein 167 isoform X1 n=1 Tax=Pelodiscus sinensis TaxID=13735 RepID=UPI003F6D8357
MASERLTLPSQGGGLEALAPLTNMAAVWRFAPHKHGSSGFLPPTACSYVAQSRKGVARMRSRDKTVEDGLMAWRRSCPSAEKAWRRWTLSCAERSSVLKEEKELKVLRKENRKNTALAVAVVLLIAVIYTCWTM